MCTYIWLYKYTLYSFVGMEEKKPRKKRKTKFGTIKKTKVLTIRVPTEKADEIKKKFKGILKEYIKK